MIRRSGAGVVVLLLFTLLARPSPAGELRQLISAYVDSHQAEMLRELIELLSIPNIAADKPNIRRNADYLRRMFEQRGLSAEILETDGNPLVYAELKVPSAVRTVLFYIHYDGQPVDPPLWKQTSPFHPVLRSGKMEEGAEILDLDKARPLRPDWRVYARSASDDKAPVVALCTALDALKSAGRTPSSNVRIVLDGEEEAGSPNLTAAIERYRDRFKADLMLIFDGPLHPSGRPTLAFGARGNLTLDLTVYGPKSALHSGHYGNWAPNPAMLLSKLLASMKDEAGRVQVKGFYDGIKLSERDQEILGSVPDDLKHLRQLFGIAEPDRVGKNLQEALQYPSLNIRGLRSAYVGSEARTIIPAEAVAAIDVRLVKETPAASMVEKVKMHIRDQGFHIVESDPDAATRLKHSKIVRVTQRRRDATEAFRTEMDLPESVQVTQALESVWSGVAQRRVVRIRTMGGTVPISQFIRALGFPAIVVPVANFDNNQHSENENLRLGNLWDAVVTYAALLTM